MEEKDEVVEGLVQKLDEMKNDVKNKHFKKVFADIYNLFMTFLISDAISRGKVDEIEQYLKAVSQLLVEDGIKMMKGEKDERNRK